MVGLYILIAVVGYLLGSVSISVLLSTTVWHDDVRKHGSGNAGATNVARVFGFSKGLLTLGGDMLKTALAGLFGLFLAKMVGLAEGPDRIGMVIGCFGALFGHSWPVFFRFHGGKCVSVAACIALLLDWRMFLILMAVFMLMFLLTKRVAVCSCTCAAVYPIVYWLVRHFFKQVDPRVYIWELILCLFICVLVIFLHRSNIRRLIRGEEPEFKPSAKGELHQND